MKDRANLQLRRRKIRDRSIALLLVGTVLLLPPAASLSLIDVKIADLPFPLAYVFLVWLLLIAGAAFLARPLLDSDDPVVPPEAAEGKEIATPGTAPPETTTADI